MARWFSPNGRKDRLLCSGAGLLIASGAKPALMSRAVLVEGSSCLPRCSKNRTPLNSDLNKRSLTVFNNCGDANDHVREK